MTRSFASGQRRPIASVKYPKVSPIKNDNPGNGRQDPVEKAIYFFEGRVGRMEVDAIPESRFPAVLGG